jgi:hypothetical protein
VKHGSDGTRTRDLQPRLDCGKCRGSHSQCLAGVGGAPSRHRPGQARLGPAGKGRSDSGVLHLPPRDQARYPEGGRRREMNPPGRVAVRANTEDDEHQGDKHLENSRAPGPAVPDSASIGSPPLVCTTLRLTRTRQDLPCTSAGETPHPEFDPSGRARRVPDPVVRQEASRSLAGSLSPDPTWNAAHRQVPNET